MLILSRLDRACRHKSEKHHHRRGGGDLSPCLGFQYAPPCYNCYGQFGDPSNKVWHAAGRDDAAFDMSIVDKVQVPKNIVSRQTLLLFVRAG